MNQELIYRIMANGTKTVIEEEPVLDGLTRPLKVQYTSEEGTVIETWEYPPNTAMERYWGAIKGVYYELVEHKQNPDIVEDPAV
jgi:hypothetical protein